MIFRRRLTWVCHKGRRKAMTKAETAPPHAITEKIKARSSKTKMHLWKTLFGHPNGSHPRPSSPTLPYIYITVLVKAACGNVENSQGREFSVRNMVLLRRRNGEENPLEIEKKT